MTFSAARRALIASLICASALVASASTRAQSEKLTKFILPVAPGSGVDTIMRASSKALAVALGTPVVIDNQSGAGATGR